MKGPNTAEADRSEIFVSESGDRLTAEIVSQGEVGTTPTGTSKRALRRGSRQKTLPFISQGEIREAIGRYHVPSKDPTQENFALSPAQAESILASDLSSQPPEPFNHSESHEQIILPPESEDPDELAKDGPIDRKAVYPDGENMLSPFSYPTPDETPEELESPPSIFALRPKTTSKAPSEKRKTRYISNTTRIAIAITVGAGLGLLGLEAIDHYYPQSHKPATHQEKSE